MNGIWLTFLLGRWTMVTGWGDVFMSLTGARRSQKEFVSVDARRDLKTDTRSYEMLSRDSAKTEESVLTAISPSKSPIPMSPSRSGRHTPDYFTQTVRYQPHARSFSSPRPPSRTQDDVWDPAATHAPPQAASRMPRNYDDNGYVNPLGMNRI
jgi:hypothetical protein